jgi:ABC-type sugar transport system ATPase subunit
MAAIARALEISSAKILILDEPTSSLDTHETEQLFRVMRKLKSGGVAINFITHFLDQIYEVANRITVLRNGALVGLAGLLGSRRTEIAQLLFGVDQPDTGSMTMEGQQMKNFSAIGSISRGVALCPEDRKGAGIVGELSVRENIILAMQANLGWFKYLRTQEQYEIAEKYIKLLNIVTPSADQPVKNLSGGNQQKVILARLACHEPEVPDFG